MMLAVVFLLLLAGRSFSKHSNSAQTEGSPNSLSGNSSMVPPRLNEESSVVPPRLNEHSSMVPPRLNEHSSVVPPRFNEDSSSEGSKRGNGLESSTPVVPPANILFVAAVGFRSHKNFYYGIIETLAREGHNVTVLTPYRPARYIQNVTEIVIERNDIKHSVPNVFKSGQSSAMWSSLQNGHEMCFTALTDLAINTTLSTQRFSLAFISTYYNDCFLPYFYREGIPYVAVRSGEMLGSFTGVRVGNPVFNSFDYSPMLGYVPPLTFLQRMHAAVTDTIVYALMSYNSIKFQNRGMQLGLYSAHDPHVADISCNASLIIANGFRVMENPRPYMPNVLLVGGLHCRPARPLPQELEEWVASSGEAGFIFFSLGSAVQPSHMMPDTVQLLVSVFASLPQKVLWKYDLEEVAGGLPPNVRLTKWAPQQDLLGDPHMRLFITHGGLLSTQEATYHGVPVLGLPVFGDQNGNMEKAELEGWGMKLNWNELTYDMFLRTILHLIHDKHAHARVAELGRLMRDQPTSPAADIAWWTGYLLRTGGAPHLRSGAADLPWYQLYNTDVWLMLTGTVFLLLWLQLQILKSIWRWYCGSGRPTTNKKKFKEH